MSLAPVWTCKSCADRLGLTWGDGGSSADGGWCGAGQHRVPRGDRIEFVSDGALTGGVLPRPEVAIAAPVDADGQMGLLL
jgi:hypothetical protein